MLMGFQEIRRQRDLKRSAVLRSICKVYETYIYGRKTKRYIFMERKSRDILFNCKSFCLKYIFLNVEGKSKDIFLNCNSFHLKYVFLNVELINQVDSEVT